MCEVKSKKKWPRTKKTTKFSDQKQKEMNCDEPHLVLNEKTQPIQWTKWQTGALVAAGLLWPSPWINSRED
jgi:hypothetical protein